MSCSRYEREDATAGHPLGPVLVPDAQAARLGIGEMIVTEQMQHAMNDDILSLWVYLARSPLLWLTAPIVA